MVGEFIGFRNEFVIIIFLNVFNIKVFFKDIYLYFKISVVFSFYYKCFFLYWIVINIGIFNWLL